MHRNTLLEHLISKNPDHKPIPHETAAQYFDTEDAWQIWFALYRSAIAAGCSAKDADIAARAAYPLAEIEFIDKVVRYRIERRNTHPLAMMVAHGAVAGPDGEAH